MAAANGGLSSWRYYFTISLLRQLIFNRLCCLLNVQANLPGKSRLLLNYERNLLLYKFCPPKNSRVSNSCTHGGRPCQYSPWYIFNEPGSAENWWMINGTGKSVYHSDCSECVSRCSTWGGLSLFIRKPANTLRLTFSQRWKFTLSTFGLRHDWSAIWLSIYQISHSPKKTTIRTSNMNFSP